MSITSKIQKVLGISIAKTIRLNARYWGIGGLLKPRIVASKNVKIKNLKGSLLIKEGSQVWLGFGNVGFVDKRYERLILDIEGTVCFQGNAFFGQGCKIICMKPGKLEFGSEFSSNVNTKFICNKKIRFGDNCVISWECAFMDTDFHKVLDGSGQQINEDRPIIVGDSVWICSECMVLKGSDIPNNSVVAARSLIRKKLITKNAIYFNDAIIKDDITWEM